MRGCVATFLNVMRWCALRSSDDSCTNASASGGTSFGPMLLMSGTGVTLSFHSRRSPTSLRSTATMSVIDFMLAFM